MSRTEPFAKKIGWPAASEKQPVPYEVCPKCGFYVRARFHAPAHCRKRRRFARLCDGTRTLAAIARELAITRERARQIYATHPRAIALAAQRTRARRPSR